MTDTVVLSFMAEQQKKLLGEIGRDLRQLHEDMMQHRRETSGLYSQFSMIAGRLDVLEERLNSFEHRLDALGEYLTRQFESIRNDLSNGFTDIKALCNE